MEDNNHPKISFLMDEGKKWLVKGVFAVITIFLITVSTPYGVQIKEIWNEPEARAAADNDILKTQNVLLETQRKILEEIKKLSGDDRVIRQPANMSFVREPVSSDAENIELILFIERTSLGMGCILEEFTPNYIDVNNVMIAMETRIARNQITATPGLSRLVITIERPGNLIDGRTGVTLQLRYICGNLTVFENTDPVFFYNP